MRWDVLFLASAPFGLTLYVLFFLGVADFSGGYVVILYSYVIC